PHLDENAGVYKAGNDGKGVKTAFVIDGRDGVLDWIDWLRYIAEESQMNQSDVELADRRGWILEYAIPQGAQQTAAHDVLQAANDGNALVLAQGKTTGMTTFYLPESRNLVANSTFAPELEQEYMMNLVLTEKHGNSINTRTFSGIRLPNLRALFRNTHVKVNITIESNILEVIVDLAPYTSKELKPVFGLDVQP
ncbi:MAG: hypothetical protein K2J00_06960, partial [Bacteroidaceae bacterium]|nr:hypothetical protein [Bacteroidaceae bacterium]